LNQGVVTGKISDASIASTSMLLLRKLKMISNRMKKILRLLRG
jgi:hypothetical protein